jgi:hypothetical protein
MRKQAETAEFAYNLRIAFRGLCPIVPGEEPEKNPTPLWTGAFLVRADESRRRDLRTNLPVHYPFLKFNMRDLEGDFPPLDMLLALNFVDVVIVPPEGRREELLIDFKSEGLGNIPGEGETQFFNWVPRIDDVSLGLGKVADSCFGNNEKELRERLFARIHMTQGVLQTGDVGRFGKKKQKPVLVQLNEQKAQAVANHVLLTLGCAEGALRLRLRKFGKKKYRELVFKQPKRQSDDDVPAIGVEVLNLCCLEDILPDDLPKVAIDEFDPDEDFRWNYAILEGVSNIVNPPVPIPVREGSDDDDDDDSGGGADAAKCSPPRTQAAGVFVKEMLGLVEEFS